MYPDSEPETVQELEAHVRRTPPDCLSGLRAIPLARLDWTDATIRPEWHSQRLFKTLWRLQCRCGCSHGALLGHHLRDYNSSYHGDDMVTPIHLRCGQCGEISGILDTRRHGYHGELGASSIIRGTGPQSSLRCTGCAGERFDLVVAFVYWHFDIIFDEPELPAQNYFNEFMLLARCGECGTMREPFWLGKL